MMRYLVALGIPFVLATLAYVTDLPRRFGAHPWWADQVLLIGVPGGLVLAALAVWAIPARWAAPALAGAGAVAAVFAASVGKARFAASYAEDTLAGQMWYFGWIGTCAFTAAFIAALLLARR